MEKQAVKGLKKLFGLARTKIRLAEEAGTEKTVPRPLKLALEIKGVRIGSVGAAKEYTEALRAKTDFTCPKDVADAVFVLLDIVEGVKYEFEPEEYMLLVPREKIAALKGKEFNLLLMSEKNPGGMNLFIGEGAPPGVMHLGKVASIAKYLPEYLGMEEIVNIRVYAGKNTLINAAVCHAFKEYGAMAE